MLLLAFLSGLLTGVVFTLLFKRLRDHQTYDGRQDA
jgi:hypothetical protein